MEHPECHPPAADDEFLQDDFFLTPVAAAEAPEAVQATFVYNVNTITVALLRTLLII